jgi:1-acyl-sn-glycerol-3-phosphate acyltransferase
MIKYKILRGIVKFLVSIYVHPTFKGTENLPKKGAFVLAGNHIHLCDPPTLLTVTKRQVHFLAKASLFKMPQALIFNNMGLIGVTRDGTDGSAYKKAVEYLKNGEIVGIYPEGTRERGRGLMPFKRGAVKMAYDANVKIIPFATTGRYRPFRKGPIITFGKPYKPQKDLNKSNEELREIIRKMIEKGNKE